MEDKGIYRENHRVHSYETGPDGKAAVAALCRYFEDMAGAHAILLGAGLQNLVSRGFTWVLSRLSMKITRRPEYREEVLGETWPVGMEKLFAMRDFYLKDSRGEILAAGSSSWLILELEKHRPVRPNPFIENFTLNEHRTLGSSPEKLDYHRAPGEEITALTVPISALDLNRHVNNVSYITWALDAIPLPVWEKKEVAGLTVNFVSECFAGEKISVATSWKDGNTASQRLFRAETGQDVCLVESTWASL